MLGWTVSVDEIDKEEKGPAIAYWYADPHFLTEIEKLVEEGEAFVDEYHGGYPNKYSVYSDILRDWLEDGSPELHQMRPVDWFPMHLDYDRLDAVPDGVLLAVEMWDQS